MPSFLRRCPSGYHKQAVAQWTQCTANRAASAPTCVFAGELGLGIAHPPGPLTVLLVAAVLAVFVSVTSPAFWDAGPIRDAVEFFCAAFDHRWQHWNKSRAWMESSQICDDATGKTVQRYHFTAFTDIYPGNQERMAGLVPAYLWCKDVFK